MKEYIQILSVFKVVAYIISMWIHSSYNDSYNYGSYLEKFYHIEIKSDIRFQRSLAKQVHKTELSRSNVQDRILDNNRYNNVKCTSDDLSKYSQLKKKGLNDLNLYKKLYNHRYSKKNILGKFDCYCEKKIFDKYDRMHDLGKRMNNDKMFLKKKLFTRYGIPLFSLALVPLLGFIFVILFSSDGGTDYAIISFCKHANHESTCPSINVLEDTITKLQYLCESIKIISLYILPIITLLFIVYMFIKILKYEKLNSGKDKMTIKEYYHHIKSTFLNN